MKFLELWVATPLARAIGWTLIHSLWEGAAISAALAMVLALTHSARAHYAAACAGMVVLLGAVAATFIRLMPVGLRGANEVPLALPPWSAHVLLSTSGHAPLSVATAVPWLAPLWILGIWLFVLAQAAGWISVSRLRARGVCSAPERWQNELLRLCARVRVTRPIRLLESCLAEVPMVIGHIRPVILMPVGLLAGLPAGQIEAILLHELAHIRRHDYLANVLQRSVQSLFFYHPAVWWMSHIIRAEREDCCDDMVVATSGNAREYVDALTAVEQYRRPRHEAVLAATGGNLMKRIRRLLYPKAASPVWAPLLALVVLTMTAVAALAAWPSPPVRRGFALQTQNNGTEPSIYEKWLNEDVVYIVTPQERAAFEKLKTDAERHKFIEQFWERRNPHPGSAVNTYKQQIYGRIAYSNQHFATAGKAGWQTDRGHMLILYGRPDEVDAHADAKPYPYEEWMYRHIKGVGNNVTLTFIDRSGEGNYQLAPGPVNGGSGGSSSASPAGPRENASSSGLRLVSQSQVPTSGTNGYSYPKCIYCPVAQYTPKALAHKVQGVVTLVTVISREGRAEKIKPVKQLPYGLTDSAIKAVKKWKFKPATGPDGRPAAVRQLIEVSFHTYS